MAGASDKPPEFSVYDGQNCVGYAVEQLRGNWAAFTARHKALGTFQNRRAATDAIIAAAAGPAGQRTLPMSAPETVIRFERRGAGEPLFARVSPRAASIRIRGEFLRGETLRVYIAMAAFADRAG